MEKEKVREYLKRTKYSHCIIQIWENEIVRLQGDLNLIYKYCYRDSSIEVRQCCNRTIRTIHKMIDKDKLIIEAERSRIKDFESVLDKMKPSQMKRYLTDSIIYNKSDQELNEAYFYSDYSKIYNLKIRTIKKLESIL